MAGNSHENLMHNLVENLTIAIDQVKEMSEEPIDDIELEEAEPVDGSFLDVSLVEEVNSNSQENYCCGVCNKVFRRGETKGKDCEFQVEDFWKRLGLVFKSISHEATKLSLAFSSPPVPPPQECESLIAGVEKTALALVSLYYCLPKSQGLRLRKSTQNAVVNVIQGVTDIAKAVESSGYGSSAQLQSTGLVWKDADIFPQIPKDNREAVIQVLSNAQGLVDDALQEIQEAVESGGIGDDFDEIMGEDVGSDNENTWSERDQTLLGPCLGLMKVSKSLLKKTKDTVKKNACCDNEQTITQLDDLADHIERLSPAVDEFSSSLYPPLDFPTVNENGQIVYQLHGTILDFIKKTAFITETDQQWIDFLHKANQHNWDNINSHLSLS